MADSDTHFLESQMALTPEENQMIRALFERIRANSSVQRDAEAEALINSEMRANPAAAYVMTQTIMMQEQAMQMAAEKQRDLDNELQRLRAASVAQPQGGGFLGGASVPPSGPWGRPAPAPMPQAGGWTGGQPQPGAWGSQPQQQPQGGGFLRSALTTAAGVAGGALLFNGISKMFGGGESGQAHGLMGGDQAAAANQELGTMTSGFGAGSAPRQPEPEQNYDHAANDGFDSDFDAGGDDWA